MTYASIMVHMVVGAPDEGLLRVAAGLARRLGAGVVGIAASSPMPVVYAEGYSNERALQDDIEALVAGTNQAEARFRDAMAATGGEVRWRSVIGHVPLADHVAREARAADLVVTGSEQGWFSANSSHSLVTGDLVLRVGRPVLIASEAADEPDLRSAVVAWSDTREARRAVFDALPLLERADSVHVVGIVPEGAVDASRVSLAEVVGWLGSHGVASEASTLTPAGDAAAQLRAFARDRRAGVVIAGAYGHARIPEWVFGGVTRDLLLRPDRCSLVSH